MTIKDKLFSTLKAVKTMTSNENIYDENNKPLFNIDEEINNLTKKETSFNRFNFLVNQLESIHSNLVCTIIDLITKGNGELLGKEIVLDCNKGTFNNIILSEENTFVILSIGDKFKTFIIKELSNDDLISIGLLCTCHEHYCPHCGSILTKSDLNGYDWICENCEEYFCEFETTIN